MKTKQIQGKREILLVDTTADTVEEVRSIEAMYSVKYLCRLSEITEEQAADLVRKVTLGYWLDYEKPNMRHDYMKCNPIESFHSLLKSAGVLFENPEGHSELKELLNISEKALTTYQMYEPNVFHQERTLVFVKQ